MIKVWNLRTSIESFELIVGISVAGPPPPPLPPPLKAPNPNHQHANQLLNNRISQQSRHSPDQAAADSPDSDSGFEVLEEPTLRPSELVKGNHNRTMSSISGKLLIFKENI